LVKSLVCSVAKVVSLAALYQHWEAVLGSKAQSFAASYLDQEKGQAEALDGLGLSLVCILLLETRG